MVSAVSVAMGGIGQRQSTVTSPAERDAVNAQIADVERDVNEQAAVFVFRRGRNEPNGTELERVGPHCNFTDDLALGVPSEKASLGLQIF